MEYGLLYIVPDENKIIGDCFCRKVTSGHLSGIQEFVNNYKLNYSFTENDYQNAPCILAKDGHMVVKTVDMAGILIFYLPEFITDDQCMWIFENKNLIEKHSMVGAYQIKSINNSYETEQIYGIDNIINCVNYSNMLYNKKIKENELKRSL